MILALWALACGSVEVPALPENPLNKIEKLARLSFDATVTERVATGDYSYLLLDDGRWVVGLDKGHQPGDRISVLQIGVAHDFFSKQTGRTFDTLLFGVLSDAEVAAVGAEPEQVVEEVPNEGLPAGRDADPR